MEEPIQGWIVANGMFTTITVATAKGLLGVISANPKINAQLVPVDFVANAMVACCYKTALLG